MTFAGFLLEDKIALVTGAGRGLGLEIAKAFAASGAHVLVNGRSAPNLERAVSLITAVGGSATPMPFDITDEAAVDKAFQIIGEQYERLDILVNNVGKRDRRELFTFAMDEVRRLVEVDLIAPFNLSRKAAALMVKHGEGRIINITSIAGPIASAGDPVYTAAKGGLEALTRALAAELGTSGITVNAVAPGFFATETNEAYVADQSIADWLARRTSLGRWGRPEEIAGGVLFLASPAASYVTGHLLVIDGGYLAHF